jgi:hypothetical protein
MPHRDDLAELLRPPVGPVDEPSELSQLLNPIAPPVPRGLEADVDQDEDVWAA